jgi:hypothetical protein
MLFPNSRGSYIDFRSFGRRHWKPAQTKAGIEPLRHLYDLRHTYATFALRAGVSVLAVSRFMGSSIATIDRHYGHLARDSREHAVSLLDALSIERAVDAGWTSHGEGAAAQRQRFQASQEAVAASRGRSVDVGTLNRRPVRKQKELNSRNFVKTSDGLKPSTPSLPCAPFGNWSQPTATVLACFGRTGAQSICG